MIPINQLETIHLENSSETSSGYLCVLLRRRHPEVFLGKGVLKKCSTFTDEHSCHNFIEITLEHGCSPVNLLHIFRIPSLKNTSGRLLLFITYKLKE